MFLHSSRLPDNPSFSQSLDDAEAADTAARRLWDATRDLQVYKENTYAEEAARAEAYERRNKAIFDATGVQLENPYRASEAELERSTWERRFSGPRGFKTWRDRLESEWQQKVRDLARERPEHSGVIAADRSITEDAYTVAQGAERDFDAASTDPALGGARRLGNMLGGGIAGMVRDPLQVGTLVLGGGISGPARTAFGRILQTVLTEATINGGVEAGLQAASWDWKSRAGLEHGLGESLQQVGLAFLFGGGVGGLIQGGAEVFRLLGKAAPTEALERAAAGTPEPGDLPAIAEALDVPLPAGTSRVAELAAEQRTMDADAFGPPPAGVPEADAERLAAEAVRAAENPSGLPPSRDMQERLEAIERVVRREFPLGAPPRRPTTLMQFLAGRNVRGIRDDGGELAAMGLSRKFVPGGGALVRPSGKRLDHARELAAEAGYFDDIYGDAERAVASSTTDDLLRLLRQEAAGEPAFSVRQDGDRITAWAEYEQGQRRQQAYRQIVEEVDSAIGDLGIEHRLDDAILARAAAMVDDETDAAIALERALEEDYRLAELALSERGEVLTNEPEYDIPFFDMAEDGRTGSEAGGDARSPGLIDQYGRRGEPSPDSEQLQSAGGDQGQAQPGLLAPGATPEPATPEAVELADAALTEARRPGDQPQTEQTAAGEQTLLEGVQPVSTRDRLEAEGAKPMRGGDAPPPEGGLFDIEARQQIDMWDAMPAATDAEGKTLFTTHQDMVDDSERTAFLGDLIASCKD